jgi:DNA-binding CsgD family transcriptional regulator
MPPDVVGRDEELDSLYAVLDRRAALTGPTAVALEGEAGIGKSTLWLTLVEAARERGLRLASARPAEAERALAYAGLGDLLDDVLEDVLPALTPPRRRALEVALLLEDAAGHAADPRAVGLAVRDAVQLLVEEEPVVVAIDDLQWLDLPSANALGFALRRLPHARLVLLWTRRLGEGEQPSAVEEALDRDRIEHVCVGPLSVGAIQQILHSRLSRAVTRPTLLKLHEASGGNPFYALELARALGSAGAVHDPTQPLPVPERLEELVSARLEGFTGATHDALALAAAEARLTPAHLSHAGIDRAALEPAVRENVIELAEGGIRFTHPLLASVLYQALAAGERERVHRLLADLVTDPLARARHLALSAAEPDAELAAALEQAAGLANDQGAPTVAAELGEHALRLTPPESRVDLDRRAAATARAHHAAGDVARGLVLASEVAARASPGAERAEALVLLAEMEREHLPREMALLNEALREPGATAGLQAAIHGRLSLLVRFTAGLAAAERHARAAVELAERHGDASLRAAALGGLALIRFNAGKTGALGLAEQAYERSMQAGDCGVEAGFALAHVLVWSAHLARARALLEGIYRDWTDRDERTAAHALWYLALVELRSGRYALADDYATRARAVSAQYARDDGESPTSVLPQALVAAHRGDLERAGEVAERACRLAELHRSRISSPTATLAVVELWSGDPEAAVARFAAAEQIAHAPDRTEPGLCWWRAEQVEALLELGRLDDAVARLDAWGADAHRLRHEWALAAVTRCRGLVAAARGDVDRALAELGDAVVRHDAVGDPFGRGRALLALGAARRRARQKRGAREAIEAARSEFEDLGAARWAARAAAEVGRIGGRTRSDGLTPAERRVADLVAQGRTNAEVAATLFLTERTVASHLTRVYAKLGVRSRTELARRLA